MHICSKSLCVVKDTMSMTALFSGIDYPKLANDLYNATLGQWGTDEDEVRRVFTLAVAEPLRRLEAHEDLRETLNSRGVPCSPSVSVKDTALFRLGDEFIKVLRREGEDIEISDGQWHIFKDEFAVQDYAARQTLWYVLSDELTEEDATAIWGFSYFQAGYNNNDCTNWLKSTFPPTSADDEAAIREICQYVY